MASASNFEPTDQQAAFLTVVQAEGYTISRGDCARKADVPESTMRSWFLRSDEFLAWWKHERERWFSQKLDVVHAALLGQATGKSEGNPTSAKLLLERYDHEYCPRSRQEQTGANGKDLQSPINLFFVGTSPVKLPETPTNPPIPEKTASQDAPGSTISREPDPQDGGPA